MSPASEVVKLNLRLPKKLHRHLNQEARRNNVSLNTEMIDRLERSLTVVKIADTGIQSGDVMQLVRLTLSLLPDAHPAKAQMQRNLEESEKRLADQAK